MLEPKTQGPHNVSEGARGKTVRVEEMNLHTNVIDKAYLRITDSGEVDIIINLDHNPLFRDLKYEFQQICSLQVGKDM